MVGEMTNRPMARIIAAGLKSNLNQVMHRLVSLNAIDIIDYDGEDDGGLELGSPRSDHEEIAKQLSTYRSVLNWVRPERPEGKESESLVRDWLSGSLGDAVNDIAAKIERIEDLNSSINTSLEQIQSLEDFCSLGVDLDLLDGYRYATSFIGRISGNSSVKTSLKEAEIDGFVADAKTDTGRLCLVVVRNEDAESASKALDSLGFTAVQPPSGQGSPSSGLSSEKKNLESLLEEKKSLEDALEQWRSLNGSQFLCGLELLERDFVESTAPTKVAVSKHAFVIDGWVVADRVEEVKNSISVYCSHIDVNTDVAPKHHGLHGHHHDDDSPSPPIAFGDHGLSKPMELLTDAVGRSDYGKIDPTVFMLFTYPLFFGLMLGDMLYGLMTLGLGGLVYMKTKDSGNELGILGAKLLSYIGVSTILFGYIYGEFAGFEILPHWHCDAALHAAGASYGSDCHWVFTDGVPSWASSLSIMYPNGGEFSNHHNLFEANLPMGVVLAFPFHRVTGNLTDLILLTIYLGVVHLMIAFILGAIDEIRHGHGWSGALFGKVSWMLVLGGGFFFSYAYLILQGTPSSGYEALLSDIQMGGAIAALIGVVLIIIHLTHENVPLPVALILGPIEAIGMLPTTLSYVRLFAVGIVGVKIAEAGNGLLYPMIVEGFSTGGSILVAIVALLGWFSVQIFAWVLGVFSPNIHAARLHFVEWMRQFYTASGRAFTPLGGRSQFVEVDSGQ